MTTSPFDGLSEAELIQCLFPQEPNWDELSDSVLIELVKNYVFEQSCATSALCTLAARKHPQTMELARWLLMQDSTDKWLKECAANRLESD